MSNHWLNKNEQTEWFRPHGPMNRGKVPSIVDAFQAEIFEYWCDDFDMKWESMGLADVILPESDKKFYFDHDREPEDAARVHALSLGFAINLETGRVTCWG